MYGWDRDTVSQFAIHYCIDSGSKWHHQHMMAAPISRIFFLVSFLQSVRKWRPSSIFVQSLVQSVSAHPSWSLVAHWPSAQRLSLWHSSSATYGPKCKCCVLSPLAKILPWCGLIGYCSMSLKSYRTCNTAKLGKRQGKKNNAIMQQRKLAKVPTVMQRSQTWFTHNLAFLLALLVNYTVTKECS